MTKSKLKALYIAIISAFSIASGSSFALEINTDTTIDQFTDDGSGVIVGEGVTFSGQNGDLVITGIVSGDKAIECTGNYGSFYFGLQNEGSIAGVNSITADTIINTGRLEAGDITLTKTGADAYFMNTGKFGTATEAVVNGSINLDSVGWVNNTSGAVMTLNGKDAVIGAELTNDYGATLNINADTVINGNLCNEYDGIMNIADGVTVQVEGSSNGGILNAPNATIIIINSSIISSNADNAILGTLISRGYGDENSGILTINHHLESQLFSNKGTFTYNGTDAIVGNVSNYKTIYAPTGVFAVKGNLNTYTSGSDGIWKNEEHELTDIVVSERLTHGDRNSSSELVLMAKTVDANTIVARGKIVADKIVSHSALTATFGKHSAGSFEAYEYVIGARGTIGYYASARDTGDKLLATMTVHDKITFDSADGTPTLSNRGDIYFDSEAGLIEGEGTIVNQVIEQKINSKNHTFVGSISKNSSHDAITDLVIKSKFINQGEINAENLSVTTGLDGIEQADGFFSDSHGFNVKNLTVLEDGDFSLQSTETNLTSLAISKGATLHAVKTVNVSDALSGDGTLDTGNSGEFIAEKSSAIGAITGSGTVTASDGLTVQGIGEFSGTLRLSGNSGIGVTSHESGAAGTVTLTLPAGYSFGDAKVIVGAGAETADAAAASTLTMLDGTSLAIVVGDDYAGSSLVTAPTAAVPASTKVFVYNAASLEDGTLVIDTTEGDAPAGYEVHAETDNLLKVIRDNQIVTLSASEALGTDVIGGSTFAEAINSDGLAAERVVALTTGTSAASAAKALTSIALMGTGGAAQAVAVNAATMAADTIEQHGSRLAAYTHDGQSGDLWVTLNGNFSRALNYKAGSSSYGYKSDLAGATIGADYAFGNGAAAGAAFTFGTGSARGQGNAAGTKNDIDYYAFHLYGVWNTPYVNLIGHVGYGWTENEIAQGGYKGTPDVTTVSAGIRAEKPIAVSEVFTVTPHIGIRYLNVDMDAFSAGGFDYGADEANLVQMPVGIAFSGNYKAACGAAVKPYLDLQISPTFGDDEVTNRFAVTGSTVADTFDARIANSALYSAKVGLEAERNGHSLALSYSAGIGAHDRVDQALQAKYRFSF